MADLIDTFFGHISESFSIVNRFVVNEYRFGCPKGLTRSRDLCHAQLIRSLRIVLLSIHTGMDGRCLHQRHLTYPFIAPQDETNVLISFVITMY